MKSMATIATGETTKAGAGTVLRTMLCFAALVLASISWGSAPAAWSPGGSAGSAAPQLEGQSLDALVPSRDLIRNGWGDRQAPAPRSSMASGDDLPAGLPVAGAGADLPAGPVDASLVAVHVLHPARFVRPAATGPPDAA
ncbi:MAG: hypothetical protein Q8J92_14465 [Parvibaculum sp.]|nr:hypothetical protein [Parvibaculum sp.]